MTDYFKKFKNEFGIHFKDSPSELELVEGFLDEVYEDGKLAAYGEELVHQAYLQGVADGISQKTQN